MPCCSVLLAVHMYSLRGCLIYVYHPCLILSTPTRLSPCFSASLAHIHPRSPGSGQCRGFSGEPTTGEASPAPLFTSLRRGFSPFILLSSSALSFLAPQRPPCDGPWVGGGLRRKHAGELHLVDGNSYNQPRPELQPTTVGRCNRRTEELRRVGDHDHGQSTGWVTATRQVLQPR